MPLLAQATDGKGQSLYLVEGNQATSIADFPECGLSSCISHVEASPDGRFAAAWISAEHSQELRVVSLIDGSATTFFLQSDSDPDWFTTGHFTGMFWPNEAELLYSKVTWPDTKNQNPFVEQKEPFTYAGEVWRVSMADGKQERIATGQFYRALGESADHARLLVTTLVPSYEGWKMETFAYFDLATQQLKPAEFVKEPTKPFYYGVKPLRLANNRYRIGVTYSQSGPGVTVMAGGQTLQLIDPETGEVQDIWSSDAHVKQGGNDPSLGVVGPIWKADSESEFAYLTGGALYTTDIQGQAHTLVTETIPGTLISWDDKGFVAFNQREQRLIRLNAKGEFIGELLFAGKPATEMQSANLPAATNDNVAHPQSVSSVANAVVDWPVPYIHQLNDTPSWWNGWASCGPTSSSMALAFYKRIATHPITVNSPFSHNSDYGWYVPTDSQSCTSSPCAGYANTSSYAGNQNFNTTQRNWTTGTGVNGQRGAGIFGQLIDDGGGAIPAPASTSLKIANFLRNQDLGTQVNSGVTLAAIKEELRAGAIVILGAFPTSAGHIFVVRGYTSDDKLIVNDPYGQWSGTVNVYNTCTTAGTYHCGEDIVYNFNALGAVWYIPVYGASYIPGVTKGSSTSYIDLNNTSSYNAPVWVAWHGTNGVRNDAHNNNVGPNNKIVDQTSLGSFNGSAVVVPSQLGVGVLHRSERLTSPTSKGAYTPVPARQTSTQWYIPQLFRNASTASGTGTSHLYAMNTSGFSTNVSMQFYDSSGNLSYSRLIYLNPLTTDDYDLSNLPTGWIGSAYVNSTGGAMLAVTNANAFGSDSLQAINAFPVERKATLWYMPLFMSRLSNGTNTPLVVQNVSSIQIGTSQLTLSCTPSNGGGSIFLQNYSTIPVRGWFVFNPVANPVNPPSPWPNWPLDWWGTCIVYTSNGSEIVVQAQQRGVAVALPGGGTYGVNTANMAEFEAIPSTGGSKRLIFPYVARTSASATAATIRNLSPYQANVIFHYTGQAGTCNASGNYTINATIPGNGIIIRNLRNPPTGGNAETEPMLPALWCGALWVESDQLIDGYNQLTDKTLPPGDSLMTHNAYTLP